jgi:MYXO-CTERM domain-containing protein
MRSTRKAALAVLVTELLFGASRAAAQRIDPDIARARTLPDTTPAGTPWRAPRRATPVLVELDESRARLSPDPLRDLGALADVEVVSAWGGFALVRVGAVGISSLAGSPLVRRAIDARTSTPRPPLERTRQLLELEAAWGRASAAARSDRFTGEGVTIADIDTALDVFHPAFFRGDAGWFDWIDVDGDGTLTPGLDAIDLDRDGMPGPNETARALGATTMDLGTGMRVEGARPAGFHPGYDWLFLDDDGDGQRDTARTLEGVTDETPAFGEPLFTPDDLDRDGVLEPNERLVRLGASKVARLWVDLVGPVRPFAREYVRGVDLHSARRDYTGGVFGYADTLHASGVAGILVGDLPLLGRLWVGIAPDAELLTTFYWGDTQSAPILWALSQGADVVLHEYVTWTREALDGGDALGALVDRSTERGVSHVCPAGNIGGARKHAQLEARAGSVLSLPIEVPAGVPSWDLSIHTASDALERVRLVLPSGEEITVAPDAVTPLPVGDAYVGTLTTLREHDVFTLVVATRDGSPVATGEHTVLVETRADTTLEAFVADSLSGFALGAAFPASLARDAGTISWPATSDLCTAVGAVPAYLDREGVWARGGPERAGEVRAYSSRGPRIFDGDVRVHVVAPDNPWSVLGAGALYPQYPGMYVAPEGAFQIFGGTSGAGPHVAGIAALLAQTGVAGADIRGRLAATAIEDGFATLPNSDYGAGRVDALRALAGGDASDGGEPPRVGLVAIPDRVDPGGTVRLVATASDPEGSAISLRWDEGYDGTWEGEYGAETERTFAPSLEGASAGWAFAKVRVRDAAGLVSEASVRVRVGAYPSGTDAGMPDAGMPDADASDAGAPDAGGSADAGTGGGGGGCGCRVEPRAPSTRIGLFALLVLALAVRRRGERRVRARAASLSTMARSGLEPPTRRV